VAKEFKGDINVRRAMVVGRRADEGLIDHGALVLSLNLLEFSHAWQTADPNGADRDVVLPDATNLTEGWQTTIHNNGSADNLLLKDNTGTLLETIEFASAAEVTLITPGTQAGVWYVEDLNEGGAAADEKVKVSSNDTTTDFLVNKAIATEGVQANELNDGADEDLEFKMDINGLTQDTNPDEAADFFATYDTSAGTHKKVLLDDLLAGVDKSGMTLSWSEDSQPYLKTSNVPYELRASFIFRGTTEMGTPTAIKLLAAQSGGGTGSVRIVDATNSDNIIATITTIAGSTFVIYDMGTLSNLPTGEAHFEVQMGNTAGSEVQLSTLSMVF